MRTLWVLALTFLVAAVPAAEVRTAIAPLHADDSSRSQSIAQHTTRTLEMILNQLDGYRLVRVAGADDDTAARTIAENDFLVYGRVQEEAAATVISLAVFSRAEQEVTSSFERRIESVFELFDAAEEAAIELMEALSGEVIRFGELALRNTGRPGSYEVLVDGRPLPQDQSRILTGEREIAIRQDRMLTSVTLHEQTVTVREGETISISFELPLLTPDERRVLLGIEEEITANWDDPAAADRVISLFERLEFLLADVSYSTDLAAQRDRYQELRSRFDQDRRARAATAPPEEPEAPEADTEPNRRTRIGAGLGVSVPIEIEEPDQPYNREYKSFTLRGRLTFDVFRFLGFQTDLVLGRNELDFIAEEIESRIYTYYSLELATLLRPQVRLWAVELFLNLGPAVAIGPVEWLAEETLPVETEDGLVFGFGLMAGPGVSVNFSERSALEMGLMIAGMITSNPEVDILRTEFYIGVSRRM
ncbi:hypothetical protein [Spirochaeta africana]|uniref:PEGA domain-containing protein n=1 Tax=Spirochaeta africana (strain ATCC 700263 / DSM 8902 / Z-7692) TaxID=889378 RepID=H9UFR0_SPIAZ|nr:hypothetical protein [Spirochaeta africana]AFG36353.1 hypothetical protein Spiaf_0245 [Spirochaeta africana DSM 8902]